MMLLQCATTTTKHGGKNNSRNGSDKNSSSAISLVVRSALVAMDVSASNGLGSSCSHDVLRVKCCRPAAAYYRAKSIGRFKRRAHVQDRPLNAGYVSV